MSHNELMKELFLLDEKQLKEKIDGWRHDLFSIRLQFISSQVKDISQIKKLKKNVARGLTILSSKFSIL